VKLTRLEVGVPYLNRGGPLPQPALFGTSIEKKKKTAFSNFPEVLSKELIAYIAS
jgi:hypothetical protein